MSKDFIVFDPAGINPIPPKDELLDTIHDFVGEGQECPQEMATDRIKEVVLWAGQKCGSTVDADSQWTSWPPSILAAGHHCTFNLYLTADSMTFMMLLSDQCKRLGLIMIDPSGRNPFVTIPGGGGILD